MALDTAAKRAAVPGVGRPWMRGQLPSLGKGREWRSSTGLSYPVADFQAPTVFVPPVVVGGLTTTTEMPSPVSSKMVLLPPLENYPRLVAMTKDAVIGGLRQLIKKDKN